MKVVTHMKAVVMKKMKPTPLVLSREYPLHLPSAQGTAKYLNKAIHNWSSLAVLNDLKGWKPLDVVFRFIFSSLSLSRSRSLALALALALSLSLSLSLSSDGATKIAARNVLSKSIQGYNNSQHASCEQVSLLGTQECIKQKKLKFPWISSAFFFLSFDLFIICGYFLLWPNQ